MNGPGGEALRRAIPSFATESRWTAADGWQVRRIDYDQPAGVAHRGAMLFVPGRGDAYEKYLESFAGWRSQGWRVTASDWRGQAGSGRGSDHPLVGHVADFAIWVDDLVQLWTAFREATPGPHVLVAHSMGGHIALRAMAEHRIVPDAAILVAPMLGIRGIGLPDILSHAVAGVMAACGKDTRPAWKVSERPASPMAIRQELLTHDDARYADELYWWERRPELTMGPASWRWVERAYASARGMARPGVLEAVTVPVLLMSTSADRLVSHEAIARAAARLPAGELAAWGSEARHEILREADPVRNAALGRIDRFLDRHAPARPAG